MKRVFVWKWSKAGRKAKSASSELDAVNGLSGGLLETAAVFTFSYPAATVLRVLVHEADGGLRAPVLSLLLAAAGWLASIPVRHIRVPALRGLYILMLSAIPCTAAYFTFPGIRAGRLVFEGLLFLFYFFLGFFIHLDTRQDRDRGLMLNTGILLLSTVLFASYELRKVVYLRDPFFIAAFVFILLATLIKRQENLRLVFIRRGVEQRDIREKIRKSSGWTVFIIYAAVLLLFNLKGMVLFILNVLNEAAGAVFRFILWVIAQLLRDRGGTYAEGFGFMPFDPKPSTPPWLVFTLYFVGYSLLFLAVYALTPILYKRFKALCRLIRNWMKRLFQYEDPVEVPVQDEFTEVTQFIKGNRAENRPAQPAPGKNELLAMLKKTKDPVERIRLQYRIALLFFSERRVDLERSDTTGEICRKAMSRNAAVDGLPEWTEVYDSVRYGDKRPSETDTSLADEAFDKIREQ